MNLKNKKLDIKYIVFALNEAGVFYKKSQSLLVKIDEKIQIEFVYATRAFTSLFISKEEKGEYCQESLNNLYQATKHILNDSLDLVTAYATKEIEKLNSISKYNNISDYCDNYHQITIILKKFWERIWESRKNPSTRIESYFDMLKSKDYKILYSFCLEIDVYSDKLKKDRKKEDDDLKKWAFWILIWIFAIFIPILFAILKN